MDPAAVHQFDVHHIALDRRGTLATQRPQIPLADRVRDLPLAVQGQRHATARDAGAFMHIQNARNADRRARWVAVLHLNI